MDPGRLADEIDRRIRELPDRRTALNLRAAGGTGDAERTLEVCRRLVQDRDDMVVKALSWALRELVVWDPAAVRGFLEANDDALPARVKREVRAKLDTGRKRPRPES